jgi:hypothetical protein
MSLNSTQNSEIISIEEVEIHVLQPLLGKRQSKEVGAQEPSANHKKETLNHHEPKVFQGFGVGRLYDTILERLQKLA